MKQIYRHFTCEMKQKRYRNYCFYVDVTIEILYVCCIYQFYETYAANMQFISPLVRQISWTNNLLIISRCHSEEEREFYLWKSIDEHYSKRELDRQISSSLFERTMLDKPKVSTVLRQIAPKAEEVFRDQYVLEFIGADADRLENSMRQSLIQQMKREIFENTTE